MLLSISFNLPNKLLIIQFAACLGISSNTSDNSSKYFAVSNSADITLAS